MDYTTTDSQVVTIPSDQVKKICDEVIDALEGEQDIFYPYNGVLVVNRNLVHLLVEKHVTKLNPKPLHYWGLVVDLTDYVKRTKRFKALKEKASEEAKGQLKKDIVANIAKFNCRAEFYKHKLLRLVGQLEYVVLTGEAPPEVK